MNNEQRAGKKIKFTFEEKYIFQKLVRGEPAIVLKRTDGLSLRRKEEAWKRVVLKFNRHPKVTPRTLSQLKKLLDNMKSNGRKKLNDHQNGVTNSGETVTEAVECDPEMEILINFVDVNSCDTPGSYSTIETSAQEKSSSWSDLDLEKTEPTVNDISDADPQSLVLETVSDVRDAEFDLDDDFERTIPPLRKNGSRQSTSDDLHRLKKQIILVEHEMNKKLIATKIKAQEAKIKGAEAKTQYYEHKKQNVVPQCFSNFVNMMGTFFQSHSADRKSETS